MKHRRDSTRHLEALLTETPGWEMQNLYKVKFINFKAVKQNRLNPKQ